MIIDTLAPAIQSIVETAIAERVFPGAVVLVASSERLLHLAAYGTTRYDDSGTQQVLPTSIYDIASITKIFTATAALQLLDSGAFTLDTPVYTLLPKLRAQTVLVRHLLTHTSGYDLRLSVLRHTGRDGILATVFAAEPLHTPGSNVAYTNINSLLLGLLVEQLSGLSLDAFIARHLCEPLQLHTTMFCPAPALHPQIVPTEYDEWRGGLVHGVVHDESAYALGGVAGHAGLFSCATDLWRFGQMWLAGGTLDGQRYLRPETVALATTNQTHTASLGCGLGWMLDRPAFMGSAREQGYGHTGFTGPVLLILPRHKLIIVMLCNRVYPQRRPATHHPVVAAIAESSMRIVG